MGAITRPSTALTKARDLLVTDGWTQGAYERDGRHCAYGALGAVTGDLKRDYYGDHVVFVTRESLLFREAQQFLDAAVPEEHALTWRGRRRSAEEFSDTVAKSRKPVIEMYDRAISAAKAAERRSSRELVSA